MTRKAEIRYKQILLLVKNMKKPLQVKDTENNLKNVVNNKWAN